MINPLIKSLTDQELLRQQTEVNLIASENYPSQAVMSLMGTIWSTKYAEGYPGKRYYGGCQYVDELETLTINLFKTIFKADHANVQPHSGSQANAAAYHAVLNIGDTVLAMDLSAGGHLTHGFKNNFSGRLYNFVHYGVDINTETMDLVAISALAQQVKPKLIVAGASAYPKLIDFQALRNIADQVGALLMIDMAHFAGMVAAGIIPSPVPWADIVTTTTHKTFRGPRGGVILCKQALAKQIDSAVFPGQQGGPLEHVIAAKAQAAYEALQPSYKTYQQQVLSNAKLMADILQHHGCKLVAFGTETHLLLINVKASFNLSGLMAQDILAKINIVCNKNLIIGDTEPIHTSGIRLGTPAITTRGFQAPQITILTNAIINVLQDPSDQNITKHKIIISNLLKDFKLYE